MVMGDIYILDKKSLCIIQAGIVERRALSSGITGNEK